MLVCILNLDREKKMLGRTKWSEKNDLETLEYLAFPKMLFHLELTPWHERFVFWVMPWTAAETPISCCLSILCSHSPLLYAPLCTRVLAYIWATGFPGWQLERKPSFFWKFQTGKSFEIYLSFQKTSNPMKWHILSGKCFVPKCNCHIGIFLSFRNNWKPSVSTSFLL